MRNLLNFLARYNNLLIFLIFEGIALSLVVTGNNYHNTRIVKGIQNLTNGIRQKIDNTRTYLSLSEVNKTLAAENAALKNNLEKYVRKENLLFFSVTDTVYNQQYVYTTAEVIDNSVNRQKNFFTLNKGSRQGLSVDMAVTSADCAAGVIVGCSNNYSVAMSLVNLDFRLSARIKSNGYFGSLNWDGIDYGHAILNEIPQHVTVNEGDTIETTGYSAVFPEGIIVGIVSDFEKTGGAFYKIRVKLITDFRRIHFVNVIGNIRKTEQQELEKLFQ
jgi:rod shape-determining protein MreC